MESYFESSTFSGYRYITYELALMSVNTVNLHKYKNIVVHSSQDVIVNISGDGNAYSHAVVSMAVANQQRPRPGRNPPFIAEFSFDCPSSETGALCLYCDTNIKPTKNSGLC